MGTASTPPFYPESVSLHDTTQTTGSPLAVSMLVTPNYVYGRTDNVGVAASNGQYSEVQYAFYAYTTPNAPPPPFSGSTCTPTTCEALNATCGTVSDNCGGTLECGSCSQPNPTSAARATRAPCPPGATCSSATRPRPSSTSAAPAIRSPARTAKAARATTPASKLASLSTPRRPSRHPSRRPRSLPAGSAQSRSRSACRSTSNTHWRHVAKPYDSLRQ